MKRGEIFQRNDDSLRLDNNILLDKKQENHFYHAKENNMVKDVPILLNCCIVSNEAARNKPIRKGYSNDVTKVIGSENVNYLRIMSVEDHDVRIPIARRVRTRRRGLSSKVGNELLAMINAFEDHSQSSETYREEDETSVNQEDDQATIPGRLSRDATHVVIQPGNKIWITSTISNNSQRFSTILGRFWRAKLISATIHILTDSNERPVGEFIYFQRDSEEFPDGSSLEEFLHSDHYKVCVALPIFWRFPKLSVFEEQEMYHDYFLPLSTDLSLRHNEFHRVCGLQMEATDRVIAKNLKFDKVEYPGISFEFASPKGTTTINNAFFEYILSDGKHHVLELRTNSRYLWANTFQVYNVLTWRKVSSSVIGNAKEWYACVVSDKKYILKYGKNIKNEKPNESTVTPGILHAMKINLGATIRAAGRLIDYLEFKNRHVLNDVGKFQRFHDYDENSFRIWIRNYCKDCCQTGEARHIEAFCQLIQNARDEALNLSEFPYLGTFLNLVEICFTYQGDLRPPQGFPDISKYMSIYMLSAQCIFAVFK